MSTRLLVLGLLSKAPMHGYEVQKVLEQSRADRWADVLPGSIYHALKKMAAEGLVEVRETEQAGHRLKATYAITAEGKVELRRLLREAWKQQPRPFPTGLYTAITFLHDLPAAEVREALAPLIVELEEEIAGWEQAASAKGSARALPEHLRLAFANARAHLELDLELLRDLDKLLGKKGKRGS